MLDSAADAAETCRQQATPPAAASALAARVDATPWLGTSPIQLLLLILLPLGSSLAAQQTDQIRDEGSVAEEITVSETSLLLDFRKVITPRQVRALSAGDVRIVEENVNRESVRLEPVLRSSGDRWHLLVYVDSLLATADTVRNAALALGQQVGLLARLGEVRILVNDGRVRELVAPTRNITALQDALAELGKRPVAFDRVSGMRQRFDTDLARAEGDDLDLRRAALAREEDLIRQQGDALLRTVGDGCPADACALLLITDGFELHPEVYYLGAELAARYPESGLEAQRTAVSLAESLSALEWVTLAVPFVETTPPSTADRPRGSPHDDHDRFLQQTGSYFDGITIRRKHQRSGLADLSLKEMTAFLAPELQPVRMLTEETGGTLLSAADQLGDELQGLLQRFRIWYRTTRPLDGQIRAVEATLVDGNKPIRSPYWSDASTPEGVAAARARGLLEGSAEPGPLAVQAELRGARKLEVSVDWGADSASLTSGPSLPLRITVAFSASGERPVVEHDFEDLVVDPLVHTTESEIETTLPDGSGDLVVLVEDLRLRTWGAARLQRR